MYVLLVGKSFMRLLYLGSVTVHNYYDNGSCLGPGVLRHSAQSVHNFNKLELNSKPIKSLTCTSHDSYIT